MINSAAKGLLEKLSQQKGLERILHKPNLTSKSINGSTAFVPYINRITILYDHPRLNNGGTSTGVVEYITKTLPSIARKYPYCEFAVQSAPKRWPEIRALYNGGKEESLFVRRFTRDQVGKAVEELVWKKAGAGRKHWKPVISNAPSVVPLWDPLRQKAFKP